MDAVNYERTARINAIETLESAGVSINFSDYDQSLVDEIAGIKGRVGPEVRCCGEPSNQERCALIVLRDRHKNAVGFCALKLCSMGDRSLDRYLWDTYRHQYAQGADPFELRDLPEIVRSVRGRVVYIGDFWLKPSSRIDMTALAILGLSVAHRDFDADWHYFFTRHRNYWRGLGARYLATSSIPFAIHWNAPVDHRRNDDCLYITKRDEAYRTERKYVQFFPLSAGRSAEIV